MPTLDHGACAHAILSLLRSRRFPLGREKKLQEQIAAELEEGGFEVRREVRLDADSIIDFMVGPVGIESKLRGGKMDIFRQLERYAAFPEIEALILVTNTAMGLPKEIGGKPTFYLSLGAGWL